VIDSGRTRDELELENQVLRKMLWLLNPPVAEPAAEGGMDLGYRGARLKVWGPYGLIVLLLAVILAGSVFQTMDRRVEHRDIVTELKVLRCYVAFSEKERGDLRFKTARELAQLCPWVDGGGR
jgi:hypothetical protein